MKGFLVGGCVFLSSFCLPLQAEEAVAPRLDVCAVENDYFFYQEDGEFCGFEFDLLQDFAEQTGYNLQVSLQVDWEWEMPPAEILNDGHCDVVAMTLTITSERAQRMDFSESYFPVRVVVVEPTGQFSSGIDDLAGKRVATMPSFLMTDVLQQRSEIELVYGKSTRDLFEIVNSGDADALVMDSWTVMVHSESFPQLRVTSAITERQFFGFALRLNSSLKPELDAHIREMKDNGRFRDLLIENFGRENAEVIAEGMQLH
ncbi:MAG: amino acid ABC transporter substrate-binding protein [bacterium]|nr:amino acid ABC transporter substrate-binding protein [bacterium]